MLHCDSKTGVELVSFVHKRMKEYGQSNDSLQKDAGDESRSILIIRRGYIQGYGPQKGNKITILLSYNSNYWPKYAIDFYKTKSTRCLSPLHTYY